VEARRISSILAEEILLKNEISWNRILEVANHDEIVYKLTLKYLREMGCDIGNYTIPKVVRRIENHSS
jgi:hypothetical protein